MKLDELLGRLWNPKVSCDGSKVAGFSGSDLKLYEVDADDDVTFVTDVGYDKFEWSAYGVVWARDGDSLLIRGSDTSGDPVTGRAIGYETLSEERSARYKQ